MEIQKTFEEIATQEGRYRCSQHNFNQAEAGYNAKWFKRGAIFGFKWKQKQIANDYALEFVKWYDKSNYGIEVYKTLKTYEQVLEIFKKEKGL